MKMLKSVWAFLAMAFAAAVVFVKAHAPWVAGLAAKLSGLNAVWTVVKASYRQPSVLVIWGGIAVAGFLFGHLQESWDEEVALQAQRRGFEITLAASKKETEAAKTAFAVANAELERLRNPAELSPPPAQSPKRRMAPAPAKAWWQ